MWRLAEGQEPPQEEAWACVLGFASGAVGTLQLNCLERLNERVVVTGRQSSVAVDGWRTVTAHVGGGGPELWEPNDQLPGDAVDPRHLHGFAGEVRHFVECARDRSRPVVRHRRRHRRDPHRAGAQALRRGAPTGGGVMDTNSEAYYELVESMLYTSVLADVMDDLGHRNQVMSHDIRPLGGGAKLVGRAATMLACEVYEVPDEPFKLELELLDSIEPGEVVVCTTQGSLRAAMWGELLSTHTKARGGRGAIIDGLTRDAWGIADIPFPVFVRGYSPADSKGRLDVMAIRVPIECGGVHVEDGDLVVGDVDGCVAVPRGVEQEVVDRALAKVEGENMVRDVLRAGASIRQVFREHGIL